MSLSAEAAGTAAMQCPKRRKLRKGTFSCRECKRRKRRCTIDQTGTKCALCQRLQLPCLGQEVEDATPELADVDRLENLESLVTQLLIHQQSKLPPSAFGTALLHHLRTLLPPPQTIATIRSRGKSPFEAYWGHEARPSVSIETPAYFASILLELAMLLTLPENPAQHVPGLQCSVSMTVQHYAQTAIAITSQDGLVQSVQGLRALLLQGTYYAQTRRGHGAWLTFRRACTHGQLMRNNPTFDSTDPSVMQLWFRINFLDTFASLILGLPSAPVAPDFGMLPANSDKPLEGLEHTHVVTASRIITRNSRLSQTVGGLEYDTDLELHDIENVLRWGARQFDKPWWSLPTVTQSDPLFPAHELGTQVHHHYLLLLAYLPCTIRSLQSNDTQCGNIPRDTVVASSARRDILLRTQLLKQWQQQSKGATAGLNHKVHLAAMILLLIHIKAHSHGPCSAFEPQRANDLALAAHALERLEVDGATYDEEWSLSLSTSNLRDALDIEAKAAEGERYMITHSTVTQCDEQRATFELPYFGQFYIRRVPKDNSLWSDLNQTGEINDPVDPTSATLEVDLLFTAQGDAQGFTPFKTNNAN